MGRPWHRKVGEIRRLYPPPLARIGQHSRDGGCRGGSARLSRRRCKRDGGSAEGFLAAGVERLACGREPGSARIRATAVAEGSPRGWR
jgi:hypothetical protein